MREAVPNQQKSGLKTYWFSCLVAPSKLKSLQGVHWIRSKCFPEFVDSAQDARIVLISKNHSKSNRTRSLEATNVNPKFLEANGQINTDLSRYRAALTEHQKSFPHKDSRSVRITACHCSKYLLTPANMDQFLLTPVSLLQHISWIVPLQSSAMVLPGS